MTPVVQERRVPEGSPVMCTLPEPAKSMTPMVREKYTAGLLVPQVTLKGDSQPCRMFTSAASYACSAGVH